MKLENQVTSLELSKKLKEIGVKQESYFNWSQRNYSDDSPIDLQAGKGYSKNYSAFTVAELGEMLPRHITVQFRRIRDGDFRVMMFVGEKTLQEDGGELSDTIATLIIYLIENDLIKL